MRRIVTMDPTMQDHILLVEDDAELRREMLEYLARRAYTVTAVETSAEARDVLARSPTAGATVGMVLCDLNLGDGNGIDLFVEFAPLHPSCHWILMSGDPDPERLKAARRRLPGLPPCTIVSKPVSLRALIALLSASPRP